VTELLTKKAADAALLVSNMQCARKCDCMNMQYAWKIDCRRHPGAGALLCPLLFGTRALASIGSDKKLRRSA
jgi:hypothetical protein